MVKVLGKRNMYSSVPAVQNRSCLVSDYVNEHIGNHSITLQGQKTGRASLWHRALDPAISLSKITYGSRVRVRSPELQDIYHLQVVLNGQCRWQLADSERMLGPGELMMLNPQENVDLTYSEECEKIIIKIPRTIITNTAISHGASIPRDGVKFARHVLHINQFKALSQLLELLCLEAVAAHCGRVDGIPRDRHLLHPARGATSKRRIPRNHIHI